MIEFKLPSLGSDMDKGKLLEWKVMPGDQVKRGDIVAVVDTSKAAVDVEIWDEGTVHELIVKPGETVPVGTVLATLRATGEPARREMPEAEMRGTGAGARQRVSPAARKRAAELGIEPGELHGTGADGAVTLDDVERAAAASRSAAAGARQPDRQTEMRRAIAAAMSRSKREIPHYYLSEVIPLRSATLWLQRENEQRPMAGRLLMAVLFLKSVAVACAACPEMNGFYRAGGFERASSVHLGVAISLRQGGLIAPAIHDAQVKNPDELMRALADLVRRARAGSLRSSEMSDPTITVTNLGDQGVESVFGVIYPPQVALVGFGRVTERPLAAPGGGIEVMPAVTACLSADHRASDGHRGGVFLAEIRKLLQEPEKLGTGNPP